ncbi:hypothetical protein EC991_000244, partial [Linnemannia zychae]
MVRLPSPKTFNRYRTVESPRVISKPNTTTIGSPKSAPTPGPSRHTSSLTSSPNADGHPPLARTRISRNRGRFSFKERTRKIVHAPPPMAKQYKLKYYRQPAQTTQTSSVSAKKSKSKSDKTSSGRQEKPLSDMDKRDLMRALSWHHPTSSLEIGTVRANAKRVVVNGEIPGNLTDSAALTDVQREVIECMQEAPRLAADVKRKAQRLIGHFIETLQNRMDKAEDDKRTELKSMKPPQTMSERCRLQARKDAVSEVERNILLSFCKQVKPKDAEEDKGDAGGDREDDDSD